MKELQNLLESMEPTAAIVELTPMIKKILAHIDDESRIRFVMDMINETDEDKLASMVSL